MAEIVLDNVRKVFAGSVVAVDDVSLTINSGEFLVLVGPSGCGKSTLLRMVAGLEQVTAGTIAIGERDVTDSPPRARDVAMVFQSYALYPHMTVRQNLGYGLKVRKTPKQEIRERVTRAADLLGLDQLLDRKPAALSGGQRQRVAIARAIATQPRVLFLDEPTSALDPEMTAEVLDMIRELLEEGRDLVLVTHEMGFARVIADRVAFLADGRLVECATSTELFERPQSEQCRRFLGTVLKY